MENKSIPLTLTDFDKECDLFLEWLAFSVAHKYLRVHRHLNRKIDRLIRHNNGNYSWNPRMDMDWLEQDELYQDHINQVYSYNYWRSRKEMLKSWADRFANSFPEIKGKAIFVSTVDEVNGGMFSELQKMWNDPKSYGTEPSTEEQHKTGLFRYFRPGYGEYLSEPQGPVTVNIDKDDLITWKRKFPLSIEEAIAAHPEDFRHPSGNTGDYHKHIDKGFIFPNYIRYHTEDPIPLKTKLQMAAFAIVYIPILIYIVYALTKLS